MAYGRKASTDKAPREDYREEYVKQIIAALEAGTAPWTRPWDASMGMPINPTTEKTYRGSNLMKLVMTGMAKGYSDNRWMTYKQADAQGWQVKRGEKSTTIQFYKSRDDKDINGKPKEKKSADPQKKDYGGYVFYSNVFNASQVDGVPEIVPVTRSWEPNEKAQRIIVASKAVISHGGNLAFYSPSLDAITMPLQEAFPSVSNYTSTIFHELGHWTGHKSRLDRAEGMSGTFGSDTYAKEELRAEISSMFSAMAIGIEHDTSRHMSYCQSWKKVIKDDHNEIFRACADAQKITDFLMDFDRVRSIEMDQDGPEQTVNREIESPVAQILVPAGVFSVDSNTSVSHSRRKRPNVVELSR